MLFQRLLVMFAIFPVLVTAQPEKEIQLPPPVTAGGMPLMDALRERHSSREFSPAKLDLQTLSDLLWAADGYNRPEEKKRTAPNSRNYQEIDIFLATEDGLFRWDPLNNRLLHIFGEDIRALTGKQDFAAAAPLNLLYVADYSRVEGGRDGARVNTAYANTAFIGQNVYLFCASAGLNVVIRGYFDADRLSKAMQLNENQQVILVQTVGRPIPK